MFPVWVVTVFLALVTYYVGQDIPKQQAASAAAAADVSSANFLAYRQAVRRYLESNPGASGTISDNLLAPYWLPGYIRRPEWSNVVITGTVYVFSVSAVTHGTVSSLSAKTHDSVLVGTKSVPSGRLQSAAGIDTGINLPAVIGDGAVVMMGL